MRRSILLAALALLIFSASTAEAALVSYFLNQSNANPTLADNVDYARVTIDDSAMSAITFTVTPLSPLTSIAGSNFGIQAFSFNVVGANPLADASGTNAQWVLPASWSASVSPPPNQMNGFGNFEVSVSTTGSGRLTPLTFQLVNTGLTISGFAENSTANAGEGNVFFAAQIAGFNAGSGVTSAFFGGSSTTSATVPLPASAWLLASGLVAGLVFMRSRRSAE